MEYKSRNTSVGVLTIQYRQCVVSRNRAAFTYIDLFVIHYQRPLVGMYVINCAAEIVFTHFT